jgi:hypothetical protein
MIEEPRIERLSETKGRYPTCLSLVRVLTVMKRIFDIDRVELMGDITYKLQEFTGSLQ